MHARCLVVIPLIVACSQLDPATVAADEPVREELFAKIEERRKGWDSGFVHLKLSGWIATRDEQESRYWWKQGHARVEEISAAGQRISVRTPEFSRFTTERMRAFSGLPFQDAKDHEIFDITFRELPQQRWISTLSPESKPPPLDQWLETRPTKPVYIRSKSGYTALFCQASDRARYSSAISEGVSLNSIGMTNSCMTVDFSSDGRPLVLQFHGNLPKRTIKIQWAWDPNRPTVLQQMARSESDDHGRTSTTVAKIEVLQFESELPDDTSLFELP